MTQLTDGRVSRKEASALIQSTNRNPMTGISAELLLALQCLVDFCEDTLIKPNEVSEVVEARRVISKAIDYPAPPIHCPPQLVQKLAVTGEMVAKAKTAYWHEVHNGGGYSDKCYAVAISAALPLTKSIGRDEEF